MTGLDIGELAEVMQQDIAVGRASADESIQDWIDRNKAWLESIGYEVDGKGMRLVREEHTEAVRPPPIESQPR